MGNCCANASAASEPAYQQQGNQGTQGQPKAEAKPQAAAKPAAAAPEQKSEQKVDKQLSYEEKKAQEEKIHNETDRMYQEMIAEVDKYGKARAALFEQSKQAFDNNEKGEAKRLSDLAKEEGKKMDEAKERGQMKIFNFRNEVHPRNTIDLHGLQVEFAMARVEEFFQKAKAEKVSPIIIITGAGNHSKDKALIKPKVQDYVKQQGASWEEVNNGSISVKI